MLHKLSATRIGEHAVHLCSERLRRAEFAGLGQLDQCGIRHGAPEKIRQARGQLMIVERAALGGGGFHEVQEIRRGQNQRQRLAHGRLKGVGPFSNHAV